MKRSGDGDHEWRGHDLETKDAAERDTAEIIGDKSRVVSSLLQQRPVYTVQYGGEIGASATARVQDAYCGAGEAEGLSKFRAEQLVNTLHHVLHDLFRRVPDAKLLAKRGIERFEERLIEVGDGFIFTEGHKECRLYAVQGFASKIENFLELDGISAPGSATSPNSLRSTGTRR